MTAAQQTHAGSCFCSKVRYAVTGPLGTVMNCHCTDCRKSHAAAFATLVEIPWSAFRFTHGEDQLTTYTAQSGTKRSFCRTCGAIVTVWSEADKELLEISAATLDTPSDLKVDHHIYVRSKAPWYTIQDERPQFQTLKGA
jgi:hypothetical protein